MPSWVIERAHASGLLAPQAIPSAPPPKHVLIADRARCKVHGLVLATGCPSGCSRKFQDPVYADDADLPPVKKPSAQYQFVRKSIDPDDGVGELAMTEVELRATLKRVLSHSVRGTRVCGCGTLSGAHEQQMYSTSRGFADWRSKGPGTAALPRYPTEPQLNNAFRQLSVLPTTYSSA